MDNSTVAYNKLTHKFNEYKRSHNKIKEMKNIQGTDGNWNYNEYMRGMYNGLELALATLENRDPIYKEPMEKANKDG